MMFAFMPAYGEDERQALYLVKSIRMNAGSYAHAPVLVVVAKDKPLSRRTEQILSVLNAEIITFHLPERYRSFPYAAKVYAAAAAESAVRSSRLVWMDSDTMVLSPPDEIASPKASKTYLCRVHLKNISSPADGPPLPFWQAIYDCCKVPADQLMPLQTIMDRVEIHPQFNAGLLSLNAERGLLSCWLENFLSLEQSSLFEPFFAQNNLYRIFFHQAVLAGTILSMCSVDENDLLPDQYNFPIFLHQKYPVKPASVMTCRYDSLDFFERVGWQESCGLAAEQVNTVQEILASMDEDYSGE